MVAYSIPQAIALLAAVASANPLSTFGIPSVVESVKLPSHWSHVSVPKPDTVLKMQIGLKQSNIQGLQAKLLDISHPDSPRYGQWLSDEEVDAFVKPAEESVAIVKHWLASHGFPEADITQPTSDWIELSVPVRKAEKMLSTQYSMYYDSISDETVPRTTEYSVPEIIRKHIDVIQPTTAFHSKNLDNKQRQALVQRNAVKTKGVKSCANGVTAQCITDFYNVDYVATGDAPYYITALIGDGASHADSKKYVRTYLPNAAKGRDFTDAYIGNSSKNSNSKAVIEGAIDTQIALAIGNPLPITYLSVGPNNGSDPSAQYGDQLVTLGNYLASTENPPLVVSTSYLGDEADFSSNYLDRICNNFMKASARGISLLFCSGDFGVAGLNHRDSCPNGYNPTFPATCPWVTAVGSTDFTSGGGETAVDFPDDGSSGGGFSNHFDAPDYQTADTQAYIDALNTTAEGQYNSTGRGFPDISLVGNKWNLVFKGQLTTGYGTSASTPAWGGMIAQINDFRAKNGKSSLGFLNPLFYGNSTVRAAFRDITTGNNHGCGEDGFPASKGWDAVTGLGTVDFAALRKAVS